MLKSWCLKIIEKVSFNNKKAIFSKPKACGKTVSQERSILIVEMFDRDLLGLLKG